MLSTDGYDDQFSHDKNVGYYEGLLQSHFGIAYEGWMINAEQIYISAENAQSHGIDCHKNLTRLDWRTYCQLRKQKQRYDEQNVRLEVLKAIAERKVNEDEAMVTLAKKDQKKVKAKNVEDRDGAPDEKHTQSSTTKKGEVKA